MKEIKSMNYKKMAGKKNRKKRDGTGPFEDSFQNKKFQKGKKQIDKQECPYDDKGENRNEH